MATQQDRNETDPLGLRDLPLLEPEADGWPAVRAALERRTAGRRWRMAGGWLAAAAVLLLALGISLERQPAVIDGPAGAQDTVAATDQPADASLKQKETLQDLIDMSQLLETRLRELRDGTSAMPAQSVVYATELEDLIARVDSELSTDPGSLDLWGQRVNLLLDLEVIYQHQWQREYGRLAAL